MAKDTFYFSHDYNARNDDKIKSLIRKYGLLGYGTFWAIVEDLYNNANALRTDYEGIAFDLRVDVNMVKSIINDFDLFLIDGKEFGSRSIESRLNERNDKSKKARLSALCRWNKLKNDANALQPQSEGNAIKERKVNKGKEIKVNIDLDFKNIIDEGVWLKWTNYKSSQFKFKYKSTESEQTAINSLIELSGNSGFNALRIIDQSISNGWSGLFELKKSQTNTSQYPPIISKNEQRFNKFQEASDGAAAIIRAKYGIEEDG